MIKKKENLSVITDVLAEAEKCPLQAKWPRELEILTHSFRLSISAVDVFIRQSRQTRASFLSPGRPPRDRSSAF